MKASGREHLTIQLKTMG